MENLRRVARKKSIFEKILASLFYKNKIFDRRRYERFEACPPVQCLCLYTFEGRQIECQSDVVNVSRGGVLLMTGKSKVYPGSVIELCFQLFAGQRAVCIRAKIVRTYRMHLDELYYSGVEFLNRDDPGVGLLLDFILKKISQDDAR